MASTLPPQQALANISSLANKVALITGGSSGLGRAIAAAYASQGAFVVSADLTPNPPKSTPILDATLKSLGSTADMKTPTVDLLNATYPVSTGNDTQNGANGHASHAKQRAVYVKCDVTVPEDVENAVKKAVEAYGRLDIMVNNAGISAESSHLASRTHECPVTVYDADQSVNARGVWLGHKYAIAQMLAQPAHPSGDRGWIVNLCSILGLVGMSGASPYSASKGAVLQMTKSIALEYAADKIHVNAICPGFTETNILENVFALGNEEMHARLESVHPWGRLGRAEDVARVAVFLAGDGAGWVTGAEFKVDGGYTAQ